MAKVTCNMIGMSAWSVASRSPMMGAVLFAESMGGTKKVIRKVTVVCVYLCYLDDGFGEVSREKGFEMELFFRMTKTG